MRLRTSLPYKELIFEIKTMNSRKKLFHVLKKELQALGYWRNHPRGNPKKGYQQMKGIKGD